MSHNEIKNAQPLAVLVNGELQLRYDRGNPLPIHQQEYLQRMDRQMDEGIRLGAEWVEAPDVLQRAKFMAVHLVESLRQSDEGATAASCAYLAARLPDLKQVKAKTLAAGFSVEFVFDEHYVEEMTVNFEPRRSTE